MGKTKKKNQSIFQNPYKILYVLLPVVFSLLLGEMTMGNADTLQVVRWYLVLLIFGFAFLPFSAFVFKKSCSAGFFFGEIFGILTVALISWTFGHMKILPFTQATIIIVLIVCALVCYSIKPLRINLVKRLSGNLTIEHIIGEQIVFSVVLVILCYLKGFLPNINGQEKFMDYGYIMSMLRSTSLPANDIWMSGYSINYYYFGQFIYALLIKLSGINSAVAYNIAMCSAIAIPFTLCYGIGSYLVETAKSCGLKTVGGMNVITGLLAGFTTIIFGNSHSFFYDETSIGNKILPLFKKMGIDVGNTTDFFYPQSTRFIGHNPDSFLIEGIKNGGDKTIEEFPFYSFLVGDLHAHVCSTMVVLTLVAFCIAFIGKVSDKLIGEKNFVRLPFFSSIKENVPEDFSIKNEYLGRLRNEWKSILGIELVSMGVLLGIAQMTNYWDFLIYFIFSAMVLLIVTTRKSNDFCTIPGLIIFVLILFDILALYLSVADIPLLHVALQILVVILAYFATCYAPCALSRTALGMSFLFALSHVVALSFNLTFDMISNTLAACQNHSSLYQLWILYGTHVFICLTFVVITIISKNYVLVRGKNKVSKVSIAGVSPSDHTNPVSKFFGERNIVDIFVCGMIVVGLIMIIAPEIFYVRDIYTSGYLRSNTMFKFTYAAFIILSISMAYAIFRLFWLINKKGDYSGLTFILGVVFTILLIIPAHYTGISLTQRCGDIKKENYIGLNGTQYLYTYSSKQTLIEQNGNLVPYYEAINWFNSEVSGTPVILETYGESYTDYDMVSAYTGLPTVCGWTTHEHLWRFHGIVNPTTNLLESDPDNDVFELYINPRHADIEIVYGSSDPEEVQKIIDKYNIEYIILGEMEQKRLGVDNTTTLLKVGTVAFEYGNLKVFAVTPNK